MKSQLLPFLMHLANQAPTLLCREALPRWEAAKEHPRLPPATELPGRLRKAKCLDKTSVWLQQPEPASRPFTPSPDLAAAPEDAPELAKAFSPHGVRVEPVPLPRVPTEGISGGAAHSTSGRCLLELPAPQCCCFWERQGEKAKSREGRVKNKYIAASW